MKDSRRNRTQQVKHRTSKNHVSKYAAKQHSKQDSNGVILARIQEDYDNRTVEDMNLGEPDY